MCPLASFYFVDVCHFSSICKISLNCTIPFPTFYLKNMVPTVLTIPLNNLWTIFMIMASLLTTDISTYCLDI